MTAVAIPSISSTDYAAFRNMGVRSQFPNSFEEFQALINQKREYFKEKGVVTFDVNIEFAAFSQWFKPKTFATLNDLFTYTATIQR